MPIVAVIGASTSRGKFGNKALRAFRQQGYTVIAVNPNAHEVEGEHVYASVLDYPGPIDEATIYVPPSVGVRVMDELAKKGIKVVWLNPGADAPEVVARARALGLSPRVACSSSASGNGPRTTERRVSAGSDAWVLSRSGLAFAAPVLYCFRLTASASSSGAARSVPRSNDNFNFVP